MKTRKKGCLSRERIGQENLNTTGHKMTIVEYRSATDITVEWECGNTQSTAYSDFKKGNVRYPLHKGFLGVGYLGFGKYSTGKCRKGQVKIPSHILKTWRYMLHRVHNSDYLSEGKNREYRDVRICEEWYNLQNFVEWSLKQQGCGSVDDKGVQFQLDKDIVGSGKLYSPENCVYIPKDVNIFFSKKRVGKHGRGVKEVRKKGKIQGYSASVSVFGVDTYLGFFNTPEEAQDVHDIAKREVADKIAEKWEGKIDERVIDKLRNFNTEMVMVERSEHPR